MTLNPIKRAGARAKLRDHFLSNIGRVMTSEELRAVAGTSEWGRRVRELRDEHGYKILTHRDRADLGPGDYLLEDPTPVVRTQRAISKETRARVLERDGYTCQSCGAEAGQPHPADPSRKTVLQMGHIIDKSKGGDDSIGNLRALCMVCNEGLQNTTPPRPALIELLTMIRRAPAAIQKDVYEWLKKKFG